MLTLAEGKKDGKEFISMAPGYFPEVAPELWNDWKWQLKNRVTTLTQLEQHLTLSDEERAGVLLSGDKLALAVTPHFFNLIEAENPDCPIRRQVIPRVEETWTSPYDMADPCGEDSHMPVPGLVHRYPDRVLFLVTDRCASYCRYCTRARVVSGVGEQDCTPNSRPPSNISKNIPKCVMCSYRAATRSFSATRSWKKFSVGSVRSSTSSFSASVPAFRFSFRNGLRPSSARCCKNIIRFG